MKILRSLREKNNLTQQQVADMMGVSRPAYGKWEMGEREPDYATLLKLADLFKVTTDYLLGRPNAVISYQVQSDLDFLENVRCSMEQLLGHPIRRSEADAIINAYKQIRNAK